jgi:hypothetical protein
VEILNSRIIYEDMAEGTRRTGGSPLEVVIDYRSGQEPPHGHVINFSVVISDSHHRKADGTYDTRLASLSIPVNNVGPLAFGGAIVDDDRVGSSQGDGDRVIERGESIEIPLFVRNSGLVDLERVTVTLDTAEDYVEITDDTLEYSSLPAAQVRGTPADFDFRVLEGAPAQIRSLPMTLTLDGYAREAQASYRWVHAFELGTFLGSVRIDTEPPDSDVIILSVQIPQPNPIELAGAAPLDRGDLPAGRYTLEANRDGFVATTANFAIEDGKTTHIRLPLKKPLQSSLTAADMERSLRPEVAWRPSIPSVPQILPEKRRTDSTLGNVLLVATGIGAVVALAGLVDQDPATGILGGVTFGVSGIGLLIWMGVTPDETAIPENVERNRQLRQEHQTAIRLAEESNAQKRVEVEAENQAVREYNQETERILEDRNREVQEANREIEAYNEQARPDIQLR